MSLDIYKLSSKYYREGACNFDDISHTRKIYFSERVHNDTREKLSVK